MKTRIDILSCTFLGGSITAAALAAATAVSLGLVALAVVLLWAYRMRSLSLLAADKVDVAEQVRLEWLAEQRRVEVWARLKPTAVPPPPVYSPTRRAQ